MTRVYESMTAIEYYWYIIFKNYIVNPKLTEQWYYIKYVQRLKRGSVLKYGLVLKEGQG